MTAQPVPFCVVVGDVVYGPFPSRPAALNFALGFYDSRPMVRRMTPPPVRGVA